MISFLTLLLSASAQVDLGIFSQWQYHNPPVLFGWSGVNETSEKVEDFGNADYYQMKWTCGGQIADRMFVFGGETLSGAEITTVREVVDCKVVDTGIELPFAMSGHACASMNDHVYVCASNYAGHDQDCTRFDGQTFSALPKTRNSHAYGAMTSFHGNPIILGGLLYQGADTDSVELMVASERRSSWRQTKSMPTGKRLFTAVNVAEVIYLFGGYYGSTRNSNDVVEYFNGSKWATFGTKLLRPRHGHTSILYKTEPITLLHIGGMQETTRPYEWG